MSTQIKIKTKPTKKLSIVKSFRLIDFHTYDDTPTKEDEEEDKSNQSTTHQFTIQMFGINEKGETCCLYITDFNPFFYIKVGNDWTEYNKNLLVENIQSRIGARMSESIVKTELVDHNKLYGFSAGKTDKFMRIEFANLNAMNRVKNLWYKYVEDKRVRVPYKFAGIVLELYESNIPPLLRYFHIHNISPSGWVSFRSNRMIKPDENKTTCKYEFSCSLKDLLPMPEKETRVPYKICSFDIEASSSHGDFPLPIKTYKRLATNLVDVFDQQQVDSDRAGPLLTKVIMTGFGYAQFEDVDLVYPKSKPTKETVKSIIQKLTTETIASVTASNDQTISNLLTIDKMFAKVQEIGQTGDGADGIAGDGDDDGEGDDEPTTYYHPPTKTVSNNQTIIDMLLSTTLDRDSKIQSATEVMTRLFPLLEGDKVTFIGSTFMRYGETEPYLNHCLVLNTCDPVDGAVIQTVDTEADLLVQWAQLIQTENPDIIIGYNIFGFDYEFMFRRAIENRCERPFLQLSRNVGEVCAKEDRNTRELTMENTKLSVASGEYDLRFPKMTGRIQLDMYAYLRKEFPMASYKLDDVASHYISDDVKHIFHRDHPKFGEVTELYSQNLLGLHKGDYIHIELTGFTSDYYNNGQKFSVLELERGKEMVEMSKGKEVTNVYNVIIIQRHLFPVDAQKSMKWGTAKDDVTPQDIFRLTDGSSADRSIVAKYCIQDCNLVQHLTNKIDVLTGFVEMAKICSVPITFLVFRGQGIKLTSYVAKKCREKNTLMPDLEKVEFDDGYEGAIVLPPKCSMYMDNPVACVDYASLYPSSMISQNLSHDSKVWTKEYDLSDRLIRVTGERDKSGVFIYDHLPGYHYIDLEFDTFKYVRKTKTSKAVKTKSGKMVCRWAQFPDGKMGIMPAILEDLLKARKDTRTLIKTEKDPFMQNILDKRQLGYKVTANSLYGQCGSRTSTFYERDIAASTTATGRMMIMYAKRIIEEVYGDTVYDTSVHGPVKCKAEYIYGDSVANYTPVYLRIRGELVICTIEELASRYGGNQWKACLEEGKQEKEVCELTEVETWSDKGWTRLYRVIRHALAPHKKMMRVLTYHGLVDVTDDHSLLLETGEEVSPNEVKQGTHLLHHSLESDAIPIYRPDILTTKFDISTDHVRLAKRMAYELAQGQSPFIYLTDIRDMILKCNRPPNLVMRTGVQHIYEIPYEGYVYDLTTDNHHFAAGIGNMIVHNTDSVFFTFNLENSETGEKIRGKPALEMTIEIAQDAAQLCTHYLKSPMELSYEKTMMPFILLSKKRYVGMLYETDPNKGKMKFMGLSLKRRDSCDYLKDIYGGILNILMDSNQSKDNIQTTNNIQLAIEFLDKSLNELIEGKVPMDKLMITKALRSDYKNPQQIGHKVLADRIGKRDPGNKPKPGDRIKFVFVVTPNGKKALMGEKIETPEFIIANKLTIDYTHYITNQLMKPLQQLFGLSLEKIWELQGNKIAPKSYRRDLDALEAAHGDDLEVFMKKKEKMCSARVKLLLFDKVLTKINNQKHGIRTITQWFK